MSPDSPRKAVREFEASINCQLRTVARLPTIPIVSFASSHVVHPRYHRHIPSGQRKLPQHPSQTDSNQDTPTHIHTERTMPGSSLWLLPPQSHPLNTTLQNLITSIPSANFKPIAVDNHPFANFIPHITVTSDIPSEPDNSQQWLDNLSLPYSTGDLSVVLQDVEAGSAFFRKLTVRVEKNEGFRELGAACREQGTGCSREEAGRWAEGVYGPHLSLG